MIFLKSISYFFANNIVSLANKEVKLVYNALFLVCFVVKPTNNEAFFV
jgi:hypothetical protein